MFNISSKVQTDAQKTSLDHQTTLICNLVHVVEQIKTTVSLWFVLLHFNKLWSQTVEPPRNKT